MSLKRSEEVRAWEVGLDGVYVCYWSLQDPLCQSQSLPVVRALVSRGWRLGLMTFEQGRWALDPVAERERGQALAREGILWSPLRYHKRPPFLSTVFDILCGVSRCWQLARRARARLLHGRGTVAAAIAGGAAWLAGTFFLNDADGPLSQEYVDAGLWKANSLAHRLTRWVEIQLLRGAHAVAVLTERRRAEVEGLTRQPPVVLPCAVEIERFAPDPRAREAIRAELGLNGVVFAYAGKAGGWYPTDAMLDFVQKAAELLGGEVSLLILTTESSGALVRGAEQRGLHHTVRSASWEEMPRYLSAADAGLSFRLQVPSAAACSPVKNGEYLACGLPIVTTAGVGDYSALIARKRLGVVLESVAAQGYTTAAEELRKILADPSLSVRCRETARNEVGLSEVVIPRYLSLYERLLGPPAGK